MKKSLLVSLCLFPLSLSAASIVVGNDNDMGAPLTTIVLNNGANLSSGFLSLGYIDSWDGAGSLSAAVVAKNFKFAGTTLDSSLMPSNYAKLGEKGFLAGTTWTVPAGSLTVSKPLVLLVGNASDLASSTELAALCFTVDASLNTYFQWDNSALDNTELWLEKDACVDGNFSSLGIKSVLGNYSDDRLSLVMIPEPALFGVLSSLGILALVGNRRRRK